MQPSDEELLVVRVASVAGGEHEVRLAASASVGHLHATALALLARETDPQDDEEEELLLCRHASAASPQWLVHMDRCTLAELGVETGEAFLLAARSATGHAPDQGQMFAEAKSAFLSGQLFLSVDETCRMAAVLAAAEHDGEELNANVSQFLPKSALDLEHDPNQRLPCLSFSVQQALNTLLCCWARGGTISILPRNVFMLIFEESWKAVPAGLIELSVMAGRAQLLKNDLNRYARMDAFVFECRSLPTYRIKAFPVKEKGSDSRLVSRILGICPEKVLTIDPKTNQILCTRPLTDIRRWASGQGTFTLDFGTY